MRISEKDQKEALEVSQLSKKIERISEEYIHKEGDIIARQQPFLISLILGYRFDLKELELEEIMKIIFLIWEFFKNYSQLEHSKISEAQFARIQRKNASMLKYYAGEQTKNAKTELVSADLKHLKSKSLFTEIILQFNQKAPLSNLSHENRAIILIGLKSLIECFEEIIYRK